MHVFLINLINCGVNLFNGMVIQVSIINIFLCLIYCVRFLSHKRGHVNRDGVINSILKCQVICLLNQCNIDSLLINRTKCVL